MIIVINYPFVKELITARKRSLRRLCFYRCLSVHSGGGLPQVHAGRPPHQGDPPAKIPPPGPHPGEKLRGIRSRPTAKGEIEGDQIQAHTQGGN